MDSEEAVDIMEPRRKANDAFSFMSRHWSPQRAYNTIKHLTPNQLKETVLNSLYMDTILEAESSRTGVSKQSLRSRVEGMLDEIGLDRKMYVIRWLGVFFIKTAMMMKTGIFVNERNIFRLKSALGRNPVLFLPTHRSYADFILMNYLCFHYDIELPAVAAGTDFQSMVVVGRAMREAGAIYMRRTLQGEPLYAATFSEYFRTLATVYHLPIEFFLEGTRSRANKAVVPKYGLLSIVLTPLFRGSIPDVTVVPINISYDRIMEQSLFAHEHCGLPKPKETTSGLLKAYNLLNDHFGNIYVQIGEPFSVKEFFNNDLKNSTEQLSTPLHLQTVNVEQFKLVQQLAHEVIVKQQELNYITSINLIAILLMRSIVTAKVLDEKLLYEELHWLSGLLKCKVGENMKDEVKRILVVHRSWIAFDKGKLKLIIQKPVLLNNDIRKKMKGAQLTSETLSLAVPIIQLQLFVNPLLHLLIPQALLCRLVQTSAGSINRDELYSRYSRLRSILKYEFFYVEDYEEETLKKALKFCIDHVVLTTTNGEDYSLGYNTKMIEFLEIIIWPFLLCCSTTAKVMLELQMSDQRSAASAIQAHLESLSFANESHTAHPYCLSLECIVNCLQGLAACGALKRERLESTATFTANKEVLKETCIFLESASPNLHVALDKANPALLDKRNSLSAKL